MRVELAGSAREAVLTVHNYGAPIPAELMARLFRPMQRGCDDASTAPWRSVGLGLYIAEHIVIAHGGTIGVTLRRDPRHHVPRRVAAEGRPTMTQKLLRILLAGG